jgi:integrase
VPLTDRMLEILASLAREQSNPHLFIGARNGKGLSDMAMLELLRGMDGNGYTAHGFRSSFRDWCAEMTNYPRELAEAALAHVLKDKTEASYQRGDLFEKRRKLMRTWAGYCASLPRTAGDVVAIAEAVHARAL